MRIGSLKLDKPWGVVVTTSGKTVLKQFDDEQEAIGFTTQLQKFENVEFEIVEKQTRGIHGRANSEAFVRVESKNMPEGHYYKCILVRPRKGFLFCTECHDYKKFHNTTDKYGLTMKCCSDCGIGVGDYNIKTANGLWEKMPVGK
jgi:hypothetical protein